MIGKVISHYRIVRKLGEGGMGVVYQGIDTLLLRPVAIKFLPQHLVAEKTVRLRFLQEARAVSALNHPNICIVHELARENDLNFMVMELVEGQTLRQVLHARGALPEEEVMALAIQICDALAAAHARGIIHRDIKPDNIMVTDSGQVKIMDFGLAKLKTEAYDQAIAPLSIENVPSDLILITSASSLAGTATYMSPEQIERGKADERSDIFALGIVLYELLTGAPPFAGGDGIAVMKAIIRDEPIPPSKMLAGTSAEIEKIIMKALSKKPAGRYKNALAMQQALQNVNTNASNVISRKKSSKTLLLTGVGIFSAIIIMFIIYWMNNPFNKIPGVNLNDGVQSFVEAITIPVTSWPGEEDAPSFSPDGNKVAFASDRAGNMDIWVKDLKTGELYNLTADNPTNDKSPRWSPDGTMIAYESQRDDGWEVFVLVLKSRESKRIASGDQPGWSPDGRYIAYRGFRKIFIVPLEGGEPKLVFESESEQELRRPTWSHDAKWLIFSKGMWGAHSILAKSVLEDIVFPVIDNTCFNTYPVWHEKSKGIFFRSDRGGISDVWFQKVDLVRQKPIGEPIPVTRGVNVEDLDISRDGKKLAYSRIEKCGNVYALQLRNSSKTVKGQLRAITDWNQWTADPHISPDGRSIVMTSPIHGNRNILVCDRYGKNLKVIHWADDFSAHPVWSPDGKQILYVDAVGLASAMELWIMNLENGEKIRLTHNNCADLVPDWSPDGQWIAFERKNPESNIWLMPANGGEAKQLTFDIANDTAPRFSPDGKTIAFAFYRDGYENVWLMPAKGGNPVQLTFDKERSGTGLCWSADGKFIYYCPMKNGVRNIWKISLDGSYREQLTHFNNPTKQVSRITQLSIHSNELFFATFERVGDIWLLERQ